MRVDIGNALSAVASPGVSHESLARLDDAVETAHARIDRGRENDEFGYTALDLPTRTDPQTITDAVESLPTPETVLTVGIGGSALGATTLATALNPAVDHLALDNVDPAWLDATLAELDLANTVTHVVSRSGTTAETLSSFLVVKDAYEAAAVDWTDRTLVTTGESGPLRRLVDRHDLTSLPVPENVPGRFSALSPVGLVPLAFGGVDVDALLAGAQSQADALSGSLFECPAYAYGAMAVALDRRGAVLNAMMPYAEGLEPFGEWFAQLWAESLGKDELGQAPVRALGVTDQHSQLQRYRDGPRNTMVTFVAPRKRPDRAIPESADPELSYLSGATLGDLIDAELAATEASLAEANRPSIRVEVDRVNERGVGELLLCFEAACILAGELTGVNQFDQPAVEWGKHATRDILRGDGTTSDLVEGNEELVVE